jgi:phospholipase C
MPSTGGEEGARGPLRRIEHIVVLMLENRSFDHKFGYLAFPEHQIEDRGELPVTVEGLDLSEPVDPKFINSHTHTDGRAVSYFPERLAEDASSANDLDPPHDKDSVKTQIAGNTMGGFVDAFSAALAKRGKAASADDPEILKSVMDYLTPEDCPVSDHLARNFCVCDNWFCSVPGPTLPNRFFSVAGTCHDVLDNTDLIVGEFGKFRSLFHHLKPDATWRWYSSDPGILRAIDREFMFDDENDCFAYFDELTEEQPRSFLRDVLGDSLQKPELPNVAWIDPNFAMSKMLPGGERFDGPLSNDDHPPSPSYFAQKLINKVYTALGESEYWEKSLLIVTYDEHGGFFDHVAPPAGHGPRVPVLLVSPHVKRGVYSEQLDHASVIKTILQRFGTEGSWEQMGSRVATANDLNGALRDDDVAVPFTPVASPGRAALTRGDLSPTFLPRNGSTLSHALSFADEHLSDLQKDIIYGISFPLRTGILFFRRAAKGGLLRKLGPLLKRLRKPTKQRLRPRRP